jgi:LPPG:FO 2-phospho-L-lactate transferase
MAEALGIPGRVLPASDDRLRTMVRTDDGELDFQEYFVGRRQEPEVRGVRFAGIDTAQPTIDVLDAIRGAELLVIAPSNPIVSVGPILALPGVRAAVEGLRGRAPRIGVSPIVAGRALKGPADRMLRSLGHESSAAGVAGLYAGLLDAFVIDEADAALTPAVLALGMEPHVLPTIMASDEDRAMLAAAILQAVG